MTFRLLLVYAIYQFIGKCCSDFVIKECQNGKVEVAEGTAMTLTCGKYDVEMEWTYGYGSGNHIGKCDKATCTTVDKLRFSLQAHETGSKQQYESVLTYTNIWFEHSFYLLCRSMDMDAKAKCQVHVVKIPQYDPARCKVWLSNWRVLGECTIKRMLPGFYYKCYWRVNNETIGGFNGVSSYYTLRSINYTKRACSFNRSVECDEGPYTYTMHLSGRQDLYTKTITVEHPGEATHNCPTMVGEGSSVTCRCNTSKAGNPPATTVWDGVKNETLHIENIQRQTKTNNYTCRVVWCSDTLINPSTLHTFDVAYGPSSVRIDHLIDETGNETDKRLLMCTAVDVHPSATFTWSIACDNQTQNSNTSTCAFSTANVTQETVVTCTANNTFSSNMSAFSSAVVDGTGGKSSWCLVLVWLCCFFCHLFCHLYCR